MLAKSHWQVMVAHCLDGLPLEACGLLAGRPAWPTGTAPGRPEPSDGSVLAAPAGAAEVAMSESVLVEEVYPTANAARSARVYTVEPVDLLRADRAAEQAGLSLVGVWHSHTHTPPYPSPTDVSQAPDPSWHYVLISLSASEPVLRSYRIVAGDVAEELVQLT